MCKMIVTMVVLFNLPIFSQITSYEVYPKGIQIKSDQVWGFLASIYQIESDGERLYLRGGSESEILTVGMDGKVIAKVGGNGGHPSEFGHHGVMAISVSGSTLAAIGKKLNFIRFFEKGEFEAYHRLKTYNAGGASATSNLFAFNETWVVLPTQEKDFLGLAYHRQKEEVKGIGTILDIVPQTTFNRDINATIWGYHKGLWYAAYKFFPLVVVFDEAFNLINQFQIDHPKALKYINYLSEFEPNSRFTRPTVFTSDMKFHGEDLYLMAEGELFQVNPKTGTVQSRTSFFAKGDHFGTVDGQQIYMPLFTFSKNGTLFLAHQALLWGHDFWAVNLPFISGAGNP